jgi:zinc protease
MHSCLRIVAFALAVSWLVFAGLAGPFRAARTVTLENGLQVIAEEMRASPLVAVSVIYRVGSRNEGTGNTSVSHFVEHMLFNGTRKYPGDEDLKPVRPDHTTPGRRSRP